MFPAMKTEFPEWLRMNVRLIGNHNKGIKACSTTPDDKEIHPSLLSILVCVMYSGTLLHVVFRVFIAPEVHHVRMCCKKCRASWNPYLRDEKVF